MSLLRPSRVQVNFAKITQMSLCARPGQMFPGRCPLFPGRCFRAIVEASWTCHVPRLARHGEATLEERRGSVAGASRDTASEPCLASRGTWPREATLEERRTRQAVEASWTWSLVAGHTAAYHRVCRRLHGLLIESLRVLIRRNCCLAVCLSFD